jgi:hypothetical protein
MSKATDAYKEAQRLIAEAKASGATELDFSTPKTRALTALPPELSNLTALTTLNLMDTQVTDLSPVTPLTALATLILHGTRVTDLSPITNIAALTELYLSRTEVTDLTPLTHVTALTKLYFGSTKVTDLAPLNQLAAVTALGLGSTEVTDLTPLAQMTSLTNLGLSNTLVTDLSPLTQLTGIVTLHLSGTPVTDLAPLNRLTALTTLELSGTLVTDPRPLAALTKLTTSPRFDGLTFTDTPFAAMPEFVGIAEIEDPAERAQRLFAALEGWVPPVPQDSGLAPSYTVPDSGPITSGEDPPEGGDPDQEELRQDLMRKSSLLVAAIGNSNEMAVLKGAAEHYQRQINKPMSRIRVGLLYSAANSLRVAYEADLRADHMVRLNDLLPPDVAAPLKDLVETHALFFMGFANAAKVHQTMLAGLTGGRDRAGIALAEPIVQAFDGKTQVLDPEDQMALADDLAGSKGEGPSAEIAQLRLVARLWNIVGAVGRKVYAHRKTGRELVLLHDIPAFILGNQTIIGTFLKAAQGASAAWFDALAQFLMML